MAIFFPDFTNITNLKQKPTTGELHALNIFKELPDEYEIYFQPFINGYIPDIIVMRKSYGVLIIEIKDWNLMHYSIDGDDNWILIKESIPIKSPIKQVGAYKNDLFNLSIPTLLRGKIKNKKYYRIVQTAVYFHNASESTLDKYLKSDPFCPVFGNDNFSIEDIKKDRNIIRKHPDKLFNDDIFFEFQRILKPSFHTLEQAKNITLSTKQKQLAISDRKQQKIRGVAGSGKTLVLAQRAVNSHVRHGEEGLILTFNITLRNYIHDNLNRVRAEFNWKNFHIIHYHAFIISETNNHNIEKIDFNNINLFERVKSKTKKYQSIFIDEIQDYQEEWIRIIKKYFLVDGGEFVVFGDEKQNIYDNQLDNNKKPNTTIKGAWAKLSQSYRLSNKILKLAENFQSKFFVGKYELDKAIPKQLTLDFEQESIEYYKFYKNETIINLSEFIIDKLKENSIQPQDVCIISQSNSLLREIDYEIRITKGYKTCTTFETKEMNEKKPEEIKTIRRNKRFNFWMNSGGIKISTVHSFKGWEINTLLLIIDTKSNHETDEIIYTALTRCRNRLFILNIDNTVYDDYFKEEVPTQYIVELKKPKDQTFQNSSKQRTLGELIEEED